MGINDRTMQYISVNKLPNLMREDQFIKLSQTGENAQIEYKTCYEQISDSLYVFTTNYSSIFYKQ